MLPWIHCWDCGHGNSTFVIMMWSKTFLESLECLCNPMCPMSVLLLCVKNLSTSVFQNALLINFIPVKSCAIKQSRFGRKRQRSRTLFLKGRKAKACFEAGVGVIQWDVNAAVTRSLLCHGGGWIALLRPISLARWLTPNLQWPCCNLTLDRCESEPSSFPRTCNASQGPRATHRPQMTSPRKRSRAQPEFKHLCSENPGGPHGRLD